MSLDSNIYNKIKKFLIDKGFTDTERGLIVYGGKDNGTVDLKATNSLTGQAIIIEIQTPPVHLVDLSQYATLKKNLLSQKSFSQEETKFFLLIDGEEANNHLKQLAETKEIVLEPVNDFLKRDNFGFN